MKEDAVLKKALIGGFKKKDVLSLIEKIQTDRIDDSEALKNKDLELEAIKDEVAKLEDRLEAEKKRFTALASLNDDYCERIYDLEEEIRTQSAEIEGIKEDFGRLKKVESQIGTLLVDAVLYSDRVTERAKTTADNITSNAKQSLSSTAIDVCRLSQDIAKVSAEFSSEISLVLNKVDALSKTLNELTQTFISKVEEENFERYDASLVVESFLAEDENAEIDENVPDEIAEYDLQENDGDASFDEYDDSSTDSFSENFKFDASEQEEEEEEETEAAEDLVDTVESDEQIVEIIDEENFNNEEFKDDTPIDKEDNASQEDFDFDESGETFTYEEEAVVEQEEDDDDDEVIPSEGLDLADENDEDLLSKHEANFNFEANDSNSFNDKDDFAEKEIEDDSSLKRKAANVSQSDIEELLRVFSEFDN